MFALFTALAGFAALATAQTNTACSAQPTGYGPVASPNTPSGFSNYAPFASAALAAAAPPLYQRTFVNLNASESASSNNVYMGYYELKSYDPASCTAICDKTSGCVGTNLYFERDPSLLPAAACPNPAAITVIKCALWGSPVTQAQATNQGQYQEQFEVLIAGSNGYMKLPSQACGAISSAWSGNAYAFPTAYAMNWQAWTSALPTKFSTMAWPSAATAGVTGW